MNIPKYIKFWQAVFKKQRIITSHVQDIFAIDFKALKSDHDLIVFDYDDTLAKFHGDMDARVIGYLKDLQTMGFKIGVVSNSMGYRNKILIQKFSGLGIYVSPNRDKPSPKGFFNVMHYYNISPERTISVGDRIGTECFGALLAGFKTIILVDKFPESHPIFVLSWMDKLERKLYLH